MKKQSFFIPISLCGIYFELDTKAFEKSRTSSTEFCLHQLFYLSSYPALQTIVYV